MKARLPAGRRGMAVLRDPLLNKGTALKFGNIFQRPRGLFIGANDRGRVAQVLRNCTTRGIRATPEPLR